MIPQKLELSNFLSYRETAVLEFEGIHLACISGPNGAGKSSILDAITWALFGQSRSRSDDDLVNRLATLEDKAAEIRFDFELEGGCYRVTRSKRRGKTASLELQMAAGDGKWKSLSEGRLRETQAAIEQLLRMNYDTFINASFLLQGKADEFTTKTPNRRKEILADLLGVSVWDQYRGVALARRKDEETQEKLLSGQIDDIKAELEEEPAREAALAAAQEKLTAVSQRLQDKEALLTQLRKVESAVQQHKQLVQNLADNRAKAQTRLQNLQQSQAQRQAERQAHAAILDEAEAINAAFAAWQTADAALQTWQTKADEFNRLEQAKRPYELAVTQEKSRLEQRRKELESQAERVANAETERAEVQAQLETAQQALAKAEAKLADLEAQEKAWHELRAELQKMESERKAQEQEHNRLQNQAERMAALRQEQTAVTQNLQAAQTEIGELTTQIETVRVQEQQLRDLQTEKSGLDSSQPALKERMNRLKSRIDQLETESEGTCPLCGQELTEAHRQNVLAELQQEGQELGDRYRANKQRGESLAAEIQSLTAVVQSRPRLEKNLQTQQQRQAKAEARLAEIDQTLAEWDASEAPHLAELETTLADDDALTAKREELVALGTAVQDKDQLAQSQRELQQTVAQNEARLAEIERLVQSWAETGQADLAEVTEQLENENYAAEAQAALAALTAELSELDYDAEAHRAARAEREKLADAPERRQQLRQAQAAVKPLEDALADLERQIKEQTEMVAELTQQHQTAVQELEQLTTDGGDLRAVEDEVFALREEQLEANRSLAVAQNRLDVLDDQRQRRKALKAERRQLRQRIQRLKLLEKACGRNGVQALLIEQALPEIEERANELLSRLTGGEMRVHFETQRQLKSRDALAETLDIRIVDNAGERPYDNYSGGEQFRVNFAIRLALSQLLAKRAGARLQTLVIDEGFGSQDPNGRQRLVEAINTIQDDFARILVITHIDELRDAFPARIEVEKTAAGSQIAVS